MNAAYEKASNALKDLEIKYKNNQTDPEYLAQKKQLEATMKANEPGRDAYSKWLQSYYNILDASSPSNEKGYHYYEWKGGKFEYMSQIVIKNLYKKICFRDFPGGPAIKNLSSNARVCKHAKSLQSCLTLCDPVD